jgi:hypothetical protein
MNNEPRFVSQMFLPPFLAAGYLVAWCQWVDAETAGTNFPPAAYGPGLLNGGLVTLGWLIAGTVFFSLLYATVMEVAYDMGLRSNSLQTLLASVVLGALTGAFYDLVVFAGNQVYNKALAFEMIGALTGVTMGWLVRIFFRKPPPKRPPLSL